MATTTETGIVWGPADPKLNDGKGGMLKYEATFHQVPAGFSAEDIMEAIEKNGLSADDINKAMILARKDNIGHLLSQTPEAAIDELKDSLKAFKNLGDKYAMILAMAAEAQKEAGDSLPAGVTRVMVDGKQVVGALRGRQAASETSAPETPATDSK